MNYWNIAKEVTDKTGINTDSRDVQRVLGSINVSSNIWNIVDQSDVAVPAAFEIINNLEKRGLLRFTDENLLLTETGKVESQIVHPVADYACAQCEGRGVSFEKFGELISRFNELQKNRPSASHQFDQGYVTPNTTIARFILAYERGDVCGKDILILGDDDLLSIVIGLSGLAKSITVFEIDERLTDFIEEIGNKEGFDVKVHPFDLRKPLTDEHLNKYDTFFTDPPETLRAADAFIGRGISSLKEVGSSGYFGFTRREASLTKWYELQNMLLNYKIVITDIIHNFSEYINWGYEEDTRAWNLAPVKVLPDRNWYRSAFYRVQTLEDFSGNYKDYGNENVESSTT